MFALILLYHITAISRCASTELSDNFPLYITILILITN
uniref:Uncharacterized protein n=1 Tax=Aegilops tauschii subsp. strangulata TaxID=200361 RepID=A0A453J4W7_AEGTS